MPILFLMYMNPFYYVILHSLCHLFVYDTQFLLQGAPSEVFEAVRRVQADIRR